MKKRITYLVITLLALASARAQQMPYYTQFRPNSIALNPAVTGTKRVLDLRFNYRKQWVGFDAAPVTQELSINGKFLKGKMGAGFLLFKDVTGPTKRNFYNLSYAFHIRYPDIALSMGLAGNLIKYSVDGSLITLHHSQDPAITLGLPMEDRSFDASAGMLLHNDRFHFGFSVLNLFSSTYKFYPQSDTVMENSLTMVPHSFVTTGYKWQGVPDIIWENSIQVNYIPGVPLQMEYSLRIYFKEKMFIGGSIRRRDALSLHAGFTFLRDFHISYSYDIGISPLRQYHANTHEVMLIYSTDLESLLGRYGTNKEFLRQKFGYMF
ncbi:MAG: type IX secretion system membrane protein PorP/SprF [Bacteroidota bacterium]